MHQVRTKKLFDSFSLFHRIGSWLCCHWVKNGCTKDTKNMKHSDVKEAKKMLINYFGIWGFFQGTLFHAIG